MQVLEAAFTGTNTSLLQLTGRDPQDLTVSIRDTGSSADGVYQLQHLDYTTPASPAWVAVSTSSDDTITAVASNTAAGVFEKLPPGLYRLYTASESGNVDIFVYAQHIELSGLTDPTT